MVMNDRRSVLQIEDNAESRFEAQGIAFDLHLPTIDSAHGMNRIAQRQRDQGLFVQGHPDIVVFEEGLEVAPDFGGIRQALVRERREEHGAVMIETDYLINRSRIDAAHPCIENLVGGGEGWRHDER